MALSSNCTEKYDNIQECAIGSSMIAKVSLQLFFIVLCVGGSKTQLVLSKQIMIIVMYIDTWIPNSSSLHGVTKHLITLGNKAS